MDTEIAALCSRLDRGWTLIDAESDPAKRSRLEDHWIQLLREYERIVDASTPDIERGAAA